MAREGQGYPCYQRDMMMMMMIDIIRLMFGMLPKTNYHGSSINLVSISCVIVLRRKFTFSSVELVNFQNKIKVSFSSLNKER